MAGLSSYAWRSLAARPLRSALTVVGIALGVAVLFAALATNAGIDGAIERTVRDLLGRSDLRVEGFTERGLSGASVQAIAGTPGVAVSTPILERRTYPGADPAAPPGLRPPVTVLGIDPATYPELHDLDLASGEALDGIDSTGALVTERMARENGLALGGALTLSGADGPRTEPIVGILTGNGPLATTEGQTVILGLGEAGRLFATEAVSRVDLAIGDDTTASAVSVELQGSLTGEPYVLSGPDDLAASIRASTVDFQATTALIAALALFGGAFLIFNTLSMTVTERAREVGLLRAAGATRRQVNGLVLVQALAIGLAGSALGVVVGAGLAALVAWYLGSAGVVPIDGATVSPAAVVLAVAVGTLVTLAAAAEPADRAGRISPVEALRPIGAGRTIRARLRWLVVVFVVVAVTGLVLWPALAASGTTATVRWLTVYGILLVATLATPFLLGPLGTLAALPFRLVAPGAVRLTRGSLTRDRSRTTLAVGALTVGLAMIVALGAVAQDARRTATEWIAGVVPGDTLATSIRPVGSDEPIAADLAAAPGVARVSPIATFETAFRGLRVDASAVVGRDLLADGRLGFVGGDRTAALNALDEGGSAIVPEGLARTLGLRVGDEMAFPVGAGREVRLRVVGIVARSIPGHSGESVLVGWPDATGGFGVSGADAFAIRFEPAATAEDRAGLAAIASGYALEANPVDRIAGAVDATLARVFGLFDALALVAVIVAALGIVNTLTMNVYERVREIGVLRATGMTRPQVWRMVVVEAGVLGLVGAILGCVTGIVAGAAMIGFGGGGLRLPLEPDWRTVLAAAAFGVVVAMLAAVWPARLAARVSIVRAVQYE